MFSALKRLANKSENNVQSAPPGHHAMSQNLQRKFAKGIQYNMKIIIKGDRNVGKTCLFHRLQGKKFVEEYTSTEEIQVASIQWNYKATDDVVKVEVWDVVDKGKKRVLLEGLKLGENDTSPPALDAEFLDVYKGTNGIILVLDITKSWSFDYVQRELIKVPSHIPVLVLGNHCDMAHHRTVTADIVTAYINTVQRPKGSAQIRYSEASMSNGFGLKLLHKFFCLPFLQLQRETLLGQLERNQAETQSTLDELDLFQQSEHADYDKFIDNLTNKRRQQADQNSKIAPVISSSQSSQHIAAASLDPSKIRSQSVPESLSQPGPRLAAPPAQPFPTSATKIFQSKPMEFVEERIAASNNGIHSVEEFMPDGGELDRSFLEDSPIKNVKEEVRPDPADSDSELETGNPLVAGFQDDVDPDDLPALSTWPKQTQPAYVSADETNMSTTTKESEANITGSALDEWAGVGSITGRVSPEGGEDSPPGGADSPDSMLQLSKQAREKSEKSKKSKHKKKYSGKEKEKESLNKEEKKTKKKKATRRSSTVTGPEADRHDELEEFLNSHDSAYEAF